MGKLYTGYGDSGYTQTQNNRHILKSDFVIELLGTIDEFTAVIGIAKAHAHDNMIIYDLESIQKKLISVMSEISGGKPSVTAECILALENLCDKYSSSTITEFTLSGKNVLSAQLNLARTVIRRGERIAVKVSQSGRLRTPVLVYINRISDVMYAMSLYAECEKMEDVNMSVADDAHILTLDFAKELALAIEKRATHLNKNIVIAITDVGANLILLHSMDNAYIASCQIAQDKAYTAVALKMPTHTALSQSRGGTLDGLAVTDSNRLSLLGGGYPLIINNKLIGGLGVSGGSAEEDTNLAHFGALYLERRLEYDG